MRIASIETHPVCVPLKPAYRMISALGRHDESQFVLVKLLTDTGLAAAVILALTKLLGFDPFCRNNRGILKKTCGLDSALLDLLLAGLVTVELFANVDELAKLAETATGEMLGVIESIASE